MEQAAFSRDEKIDDATLAAEAAGRPFRYDRVARRKTLQDKRSFVAKVGENEEYVVDPSLDWKERGPTALTNVHKALMYRLIDGVQLRDAAIELGIAPRSASIIARSPLFRAELRRMEIRLENRLCDNIGDKYRQTAPRAYHTIVDLMSNSENERVRLDAAKAVNEEIRREEERRAVEKQKSDHSRSVSLAWERRKRLLRADGGIEETVERVEQLEPIMPQATPSESQSLDPSSSFFESFVLDSHLDNEDVVELHALASKGEGEEGYSPEAVALYQELTAAGAIKVRSNGGNGGNGGNGKGENEEKSAKSPAVSSTISDILREIREE